MKGSHPLYYSLYVKVDRLFALRGESRLIRSVMAYRRHSFFLILKGLISKNHLMLLNNFYSDFERSKSPYADFFDSVQGEFKELHQSRKVTLVDFDICLLS
jgi:hypothetical protein